MKAESIDEPRLRSLGAPIIIENNGLLFCFSVPSCTSKYVGEYCQYRNPCLTGHRCQNGGSCFVRDDTNGAPSFFCSCPVGYSASLCEIKIDNACDSSPCANNGTCVLHSLYDYTCTCANGYAGEFASYPYQHEPISPPTFFPGARTTGAYDRRQLTFRKELLVPLHIHILSHPNRAYFQIQVNVAPERLLALPARWPGVGPIAF
jgi:hypothetical protein